MRNTDKINWRRRAKETLAFVMSLLLFFNVAGMPLQAFATDTTVSGLDSLSRGDYFWEGDTLTVQTDEYTTAAVQNVTRGIEGVLAPMFIEPEYITGTEQYISGDAYYYKNPTITFAHKENFDFPDIVRDSFPSLYEVQGVSQNSETNNMVITFSLLYGFHIQFDGSDLENMPVYGDLGNTDAIFTAKDRAPSLSADSVLGDFLGWTTVEDYDGTGGRYFPKGSEMVFTAYGDAEDIYYYDTTEISSASGGIMTLYPMFNHMAPAGTMTVSMSDYSVSEASSVTNPAPSDYTGTGRTFSWKYYEIDEDGEVIAGTTPSTSAPDEPGHYLVEVTAEATDTEFNEDGGLVSRGYPEETATDTFTVTGTQDSIVFNADGKQAYVGAFGNTLLIPDLVTGVKDNAEVHFQMSVGDTVMDLGEDEYYEGANSTTKVQILIGETDLYEAYTSPWYDFPISELDWPSEKCTVSGTKVEGATVNGYDVYKGSVVITPPTGFSVPREEVRRDSDGMDKPEGILIRNEDQAETGVGTYLEEGSIWVDIESPSVMEGSLVVDGEESDDSLEEDASFTATKVEFDVFDNNYFERSGLDDGATVIEAYPSLQSVTVDGEEIPFDSDFENVFAHVELTNDIPGEKEFTVVATDVAGHVSSWTVTLNYPSEDVPDPAYTLSGTEGENDYYISDVYLIPHEGYLISDDVEDPDSFDESLEYTDSLEEVWLQNEDSGMYTDAVTVEPVKIDKDKPVFDSMGTDQDGNSVRIRNNGSVKVQTVEFAVTDDHLASVILDGDPVEVSEGKAIIKLVAEKEEITHEIKAIDEAGLFSTLTLTTLVYGQAEGKVRAISGLYYTGEEQKLVEPAKEAVHGIYVYRLGNGEDSSDEDGYTSEIPTAAEVGTYEVWYKVIGDDFYQDSEPKMIEATIARQELTVEWSDETSFVFDGEAHIPSFTVKNADGEDMGVSVTVWEDDSIVNEAVSAGKYTARLALDEESADRYELPSDKAKCKFTILKDGSTLKEPKALKLTYNGEEQTLVSAGKSEDGTVVYALKKGGDYNEELPKGKDAGEYTVWFKVLGDPDHEDTDPQSVKVTIEKKVISLTWSGTTYDYDGNSHCPEATAVGIHKNDTCTVTVEGAATDAGNHTATATALSNANYKLPENPSTGFVINGKPNNNENNNKPAPDPGKKAGNVTVSMAGFYYGGTASVPMIGSTTNDVSKAGISYKHAGAGDDTYSSNMPTEVGTYTVRVSLPENNEYSACSATTDFAISYLPLPDGAFSLSGTKGHGAWYTSAISVVPGDGYEISYRDRSNFSTKPILFEEGSEGGNIFVRKISTGEQTAAVRIADLRIDTEAPVVVGMETGKIYYADEDGLISGLAKDKHISEITVDGKKVELKTDSEGRNIFELPNGKRKQKVKIVITDEAGNETVMEVITAPGWMRDGVIREGDLFLEEGDLYKTPEGSTWSADGDATTYQGGIEFYAPEGDYTFHKN